MAGLTPLDLRHVLSSAVGPTTKGFPGVSPSMALADVGAQGWNVLAEDLPLPLLLLKGSALQHNLEVMQAYCVRHGLLLAPHAKTTMAPQLVDAQLRAGAWGVTVASAQQAQVFRAVGCRRLVIANQVVGAPNLRYLAEQLREDPSFELFSWVDSPAAVEALVEAGKHYGMERPWQVLLEIGWQGGRTGARDEREVRATVDAVVASSGAVELVGVSVFEGLLGVATIGQGVGGGVSTDTSVEELLRSVVATANRLHRAGVLPEGYLLTGGGSTSFDAARAHFTDAPGSPRVLLRSGCYVTHDHGMNDALSPLGSVDHRADPADGALQAALELWAYVHATPEPGLAFLTLGRRDAPYDAGLPLPLFRIPRGSSERIAISRAEVTGLNDQHCYLRHEGDLQVGDRVVLGISHPCTAFDKWQVIPLVDDEWNVVDAIRTYF